MFADRATAGRELADRIAPRLAGQRARIFGLARGGVIVGRAVADRLGLPLDVLIACKVGAPGQPELAVGAVAEGGGGAWDADLLREIGLDQTWCLRAADLTRLELERRLQRYRTRPLAVAPEEVAVVVDDGIATGCTMLAAVRGLAALGASRRVVATPLAAREAIARLAGEAEWVVAVEMPEPFGAVGAHYGSFEPVPDHELMRALAEAGTG